MGRNTDMKKYLISLILIMAFALTSCSYNSEELAEKNKQEHDEKCEYIMEQMELKLETKYAMGSSVEQPFDVYDLSKGGNKAWFQYGVYPAKAVSYILEDPSEEFDVQIETNGERFGPMKDNYYGILYGEEAMEEIYDLLAQYPVEDVRLEYLPAEDIPRATSELKQHIRVWGKYHVYEPDEVDLLCEMIDNLNSEGCVHRITIYKEIDGGKGSRGSDNLSSKEIRDYFK